MDLFGSNFLLPASQVGRHERQGHHEHSLNTVRLWTLQELVQTNLGSVGIATESLTALGTKLKGRKGIYWTNCRRLKYFSISMD